MASFDQLVCETREFEVDGLFPQGSADLIKERLEWGDKIGDTVKDADNIAEAVSERTDIKSAVPRRISSAARPVAFIALNT